MSLGLVTSRRTFVGSLAIVAVAALVLWLAPSDSYIFLPDPARPADSAVQVENERTAEEEGGIYFLEVSVRKASLLERFFPSIRDGGTILSADAYNPRGLSSGQLRRESLSEMSESQRIAVLVALRSLGREVIEEGAEISEVRDGFPADGVLRPGDVIVAVADSPVVSPEELSSAMQGTRPGDTVALTIRREGREETLEVGTRSSPDDAARAVLGVTVAPELRFPIDVRFETGTIGGPSAGLAFALEIVDELGTDVDHGRRIAVTGQLDPDGGVHAVGGVKQKTIGARQARADLFLVPEENADEAREHADGLEIVPVETFDEAISALENP